MAGAPRIPTPEKGQLLPSPGPDVHVRPVSSRRLLIANPDGARTRTLENCKASDAVWVSLAPWGHPCFSAETTTSCWGPGGSGGRTREGLRGGPTLTRGQQPP